MKAAAYCASRNKYETLKAPINSLLTNSDVDKIYCIIEDDVLPYEVSSKVECINVSGQTYFKPDGLNVKARWTYFTLMRATLAKLFPDLDRILSLDIDTLVVQDISELWDLDISDYYLSASQEPLKAGLFGGMYVNVGVTLFNLELMRKDGIDDKLIEALNTKRYDFADQDACNDICVRRILDMPSIYNANAYTLPCTNPKILHYAAQNNYEQRPEWRAWAERSVK